MKKLLTVLLAALVLPAVALAADYQNVSMVDTMCLSKVKANPDKHPVSCALECASSGYQIKTSDGTWMKLDANGNKLAVAELKSAKRKDHVRVNVTGEPKGDTVAVSSLKLAD